MKLLVDIGNSRIKWSTPDDLRLGHSEHGSCQDLLQTLQTRWNGMQRPVKVWVSSVAKGEVLEQLSGWISKAWGISPILVKAVSSQLDVINGYHEPDRLGVDRWLAMLGARAISTTANLVVDCGTATTIDSMDAQGRHLGGVILPGVRVMKEVLERNTAIQVSGQAMEYSIFARDTSSAIASAAVMATSCLIKDAAMRLQSRVGSEVSCLLTGGAARELNGLLELEVRHEPNLVLNGLALVAEQSTNP
ncbi:MAG: type III pantothenate kinase [Chromatiales bacterium]|jgi:type III pantothenate kinase